MRVQIPAYTDRWMMGDRYGEVTDRGWYLGQWCYRVKLDKSGKTLRFIANDCKEV